eukprot:4052611-Lingulodinium_polyedra.AAC.1
MIRETAIERLVELLTPSGMWGLGLQVSWATRPFSRQQLSARARCAALAPARLSPRCARAR